MSILRFLGGIVGSVADSLVMMTKYKQVYSQVLQCTYIDKQLTMTIVLKTRSGPTCLMRYNEVMTYGTPQVGKIGSFVCARFLCDVFW